MDTATKDGVHTWTFGDQLWQQTPDGRFSLHSVAGVSTSDTRIDLDYLAGARQSLAVPGDHLPGAFRFCPQSGQALSAPAGNRKHRWLPPYGTGGGSRLIADSELDDAQAIVASIFARLDQDRSRDFNASKAIVTAPARNGLHFFVADAGGYRDALFALSRAGGLFLWLREADRWQQLAAQSAPIGSIDHEHWALSVALHDGARGHDLLIAGCSAAVLVSIEPWAGQYRTRIYPGKKTLAGAGELAGAHWLPMQMTDGSVQLLGRTDSEWKTLPIEGSGDVTLFEQLSAPLIDVATGRLLWIGKHGYLTLHQAGLQAHWQAWPNGASAWPHMGPPFRDGRGLWQLVNEPGGAYYVQVDHRSDSRSGQINSTRMSTGHATFKNDIRLELPWDEEYDEDLYQSKDQAIYPFIEFSNGRYLLSVRGPEELRAKDFMLSGESLEVEYRLSQIDGMSFGLKATVREPWNAQWFFFDNAMWLYIDSSGALYRWNA